MSKSTSKNTQPDALQRLDKPSFYRKVKHWAMLGLLDRAIASTPTAKGHKHVVVPARKPNVGRIPPAEYRRRSKKQRRLARLQKLAGR